jgi:hypothetical protein
MLKFAPVLPSARFTKVYAHGWLPLKTTEPPLSGQAVRLVESVVALILAQGYCHWDAGAVKESARQVGVRSLKWAVAVLDNARVNRAEASILAVGVRDGEVGDEGIYVVIVGMLKCQLSQNSLNQHIKGDRESLYLHSVIESFLHRGTHSPTISTCMWKVVCKQNNPDFRQPIPIP